MSCEPTNQNVAFYLQGVTVESSPTVTTDYFVTASLPSSAVGRRVWQFTTQGVLTGAGTWTLDYTQAHNVCPEFNITFEGALNGTLLIHNETFSAKKYLSYRLISPYVLVLTLERLPKSIVKCYGPDAPQNYYFSINLNDSSTNYYSCTTSGILSWTLQTGVSRAVVGYFIVGGGGSGGNNCLAGGGGGAGQVLQGNINLHESTGSWNVTVGDGGKGIQACSSSPCCTSNGNNGMMTTVTDISGNIVMDTSGTNVQAVGGEGGLSNDGYCLNGGESGNGFSGGGGYNGSTVSSGGGGGSTGTGYGGGSTTAGDGGPGTTYNNVSYGGGGGGSSYTLDGGNGVDGGGSGAYYSQSQDEYFNSTSGSQNTGGGGGGQFCGFDDSSPFSGNGGSGVFIVSYNTSEVKSFTFASD